jgi:hypothetical protein
MAYKNMLRPCEWSVVARTRSSMAARRMPAIHGCFSTKMSARFSNGFSESGPVSD